MSDINQMVLESLLSSVLKPKKRKIKPVVAIKRDPKSIHGAFRPMGNGKFRYAIKGESVDI